MQILYTCIYLQELFSYRKKNHRFYVYCEGNSWNILKCKTTKVCLMKSPNILRTRCEKVFFLRNSQSVSIDKFEEKKC